ncbi:MAG: UDP-N-acetylmuramoyl-L-alanyl-D-glutamate--2,6-diaminopimelate ligase [Candidatus Thiodiazotropha sp. 6PLUC9]
MMTATEIPETHRLSTLLSGMADVAPHLDRDINGLCLDSRKLVVGDLFLACAGTQQHGLVFAEQAIAGGAAAIAWESGSDNAAQLAAELAEASVPMIAVAELSKCLSQIAGRLYADPSHQMTLYGITGTNGKTSICQLLAQALGTVECCGIVGTLGAGLPGQLTTTGMTTPDAITVQKLLADLLEQGASSVAMEVSSHALDQYRVEALTFDCAIFTNLSRDHFDYHGSLENYAEAKRRLFEMAGVSAAVINLDDPFGRELAETLSDKLAVFGYAVESETVVPDGLQGWVVAKQVEPSQRGLSISIETDEGAGLLVSALLGRFNAANLLAVLSVLHHKNWPLSKAIDVLSRLSTVPGRMELFGGAGKPSVVVDYAHTPDALEKALQALRLHCPGRLFVVFGCGGDRDHGKRPMMAEVAERLADLCYLTDDNPRSESSEQILEQILAGMTKPDLAKVIPDRGSAIRTSVLSASADDLVLVAGKGHEDYQLIGDQVLHFDDREAVVAALDSWPGGINE